MDGHVQLGRHHHVEHDRGYRGSLGTLAHTYADGPNNYTVSVTVTDDHTSDTDTFQVHVNNVAPTVVLTGATLTDEGNTETYDFTVTDPVNDPWTVTRSIPRLK